MYCRAPRVLLPCSTSPTTVPYKSYLRQNLKLQFHNIVIYLPTYTHCDTWVHLYNSVWTGAMNRPLRLRNVRCNCLCTINVYSTCTQYLSQHHAANCPRTPTFTPRTRNIYPRTPTFTPRAPIVMRDCIYTIRYGRARWIGPLRLRNVRCDCSRTPTFTYVHPL